MYNVCDYDTPFGSCCWLCYGILTLPNCITVHVGTTVNIHSVVNIHLDSNTLEQHKYQANKPSLIFIYLYSLIYWTKSKCTKKLRRQYSFLNLFTKMTLFNLLCYSFPGTTGILRHNGESCLQRLIKTSFLNASQQLIHWKV